MGTLAWGAQGGSAEELDGKPRHLHHPHTATLKGTRVKASNGDNYIILAPINPGSQVPQTGGGLHLHHLLPNYQQQNSNFANYQNCTIVRSHTPHGNYGYVKVAPKILIFPIFVQPLDLCSRTLIISEEMILHESKHHSLKVTVFVYSDLMLVTRENEPGRCNVLQSPLYLRQLRLQDDYAEELRFYLIHMTEKCDCLLSLEAYSADQKRRVCQCLKDNIDKQLQLHRRDSRDSPFTSSVQMEHHPVNLSLAER
uniref:Si:ch211-154e10.1 n=1 Tax=Stegastes partitus TaxID=144197 RepID=A0A3B4ZR35_9TELE